MSIAGISLLVCNVNRGAPANVWEGWKVMRPKDQVVPSEAWRVRKES